MKVDSLDSKCSHTPVGSPGDVLNRKSRAKFKGQRSKFGPGQPFIRKRTFLGLYRRPVPRVLEGSWGGPKGVLGG